MPEGVVSINNGAFAGCEFESLSLPKSLMWLGYRVFEGCMELEKLERQPGEIIVGPETFAGCGIEL